MFGLTNTQIIYIEIIYFLIGIGVSFYAFSKWYGKQYKFAKDNLLPVDDGCVSLWLLFATLGWPITACFLLIEYIQKKYN